MANFFSTTFSIFESRLYPIGQPQPAAILDIGQEGNRIVLLVRIEQEFRNYGLRPGRIADVKLVPSTLKELSAAKLVYLDRGDIGYLRSKVVKADLVLSHAPYATKEDWIWYAYFYDENGREVAYVGAQVERVK